ncbi:MAG: serine hydroxymethyltransferase [Acidobacteria bacterium]|nr:serine hydroxymethyltransferase [Acidobacteriota bacterium]MCI0625038.1 serine hydroxymethyltransferase [Acidobacteriota bacterium]MCI0719444.1 serine hydroxymethyltransferase [Acidobacteriota bacterium]
MNSFAQELNFFRSELIQESQWRSECLNLIASENTTSPLVSELLANDLSHRYGDYRGLDLQDRKYRGCRFVVTIEEKAHELGKKLFAARFVDLRPLSGHVAGIAAIMALTEPGDSVMELDEGGGHRLNQKLSLCSLTRLKTVHIPFDASRFNIDLQRTEELLRKEKPRVLILGSSQFLFPHPVRQIRETIGRVSPATVLVYDASHVLGLIAVKHFQQPLEEGADLVFASTHKTLGGPQGGLVFTNRADLAKKVGEAIYPAIVTNHHLNRLPALAVAFLEMLAHGERYASEVVANAKALACEIHRRGIPVVAANSGHTQSHTFLLQAAEFGTGRELSERLENVNIIAGECKLPASLGTEGIRMGSQEMTRYGMTRSEAPEIAELIVGALRQEVSENRIKSKIKQLRRSLNRNRFDFSLQECNPELQGPVTVP